MHGKIFSLYIQNNTKVAEKVQIQNFKKYSYYHNVVFREIHKTALSFIIYLKTL